MIDDTLLKFVSEGLSAAFGAIAAYAAIRSDLADHKARIKNLEESSNKAHERIDSILMQDK